MHTDILYSLHNRYYVTTYFRLEVILKKTVENTPSEGLGWMFLRTVQAMITKFYTSILDNRPHKPAAYDVTNFILLTAKCN